MHSAGAIRVREYGTSGPWVALLHGGPGAPGYMAPLARELSDSFRVLEPLQRGSGDAPLTVALHVADLHDALKSRFDSERPALVGHSWGAMLALAYGAAHPDRFSMLVLVGCGTFDHLARDRLKATCEARMDPSLRERMDRLAEEIADPDERMKALAHLLDGLYSYDLAGPLQSGGGCDALAHQQTWDDMVRLQDEGVYPAAFAGIQAPVVMLHGAFDPHPGPLIRAGLLPHLPQLEYVEWQRCGHYPWRERAVRAEFHAVLRWILNGRRARELGPGEFVVANVKTGCET